MKIALSLIIIAHGLIHLFGFAKAFNLSYISQLTHISRPNGLLWLTAAVLFIACALLLLIKNDLWWMLAAPAVIISQYLIISVWQEAKFGTIANAVILMAIVAGYAGWNFHNKYRKEVDEALEHTVGIADTILTEADLRHLPPPVRRCLAYTGAIGKPRVNNFRMAFAGRIRQNAQSEWMPFTSVQYNFIDAPARLFFMKAPMRHLPVAGFHCFKNGKAAMDIRLLSLINVQYQSGKEMDTAETVTYFNDMCCMAPATLIDKRINWLEAEGNKVKAAFTNSNITVTAWLHFNDAGELINFVSDDRYAAGDNHTMRKLRWSTPLRKYKTIGSNRLASEADLIYSYPEGDFCYGNFTLTGTDYNCKKLR